MTKRKTTLFLAGIMSFSLVFGSGIKVSAATKVTIEQKKENPKIINGAQYLSDFQAISQTVSWGDTVPVDKNLSGQALKIRVDNETIVYDKGIYAHGPAVLEYNISNRDDNHDTFYTRLGIDQNNTNSCDGIVATVQVYNETSKQWRTLEVCNNKVIKALDNSIEIKEKLQDGDSKIKFITTANGSITNDGLILADAKFVKDGYDPEAGYCKNIKTVANYDAELNKNNAETNIKKNSNLIYGREFVSRFGYHTLQRFYEESEENKDLINFIFNKPEVLKSFIEGGEIYGTPLNVLKDLKSIKKAYPKDVENETLLKVMIATSLAFARGDVKSIGGTSKISDALGRYEYYKEQIEKNKLYNTEEFKKLPIELMRVVVGTYVNNRTLYFWQGFARDFNENASPKLNIWTYFGKYKNLPYNQAYQWTDEKKAEYIERYHLNEFKGMENPSASDYDVYMYNYYGNICWATSREGRGMWAAYGVPAIVNSQPSHECIMEFHYGANGQHTWGLNNNIGGWPLAGATGWGNSPYILPLSWGMDSWCYKYKASYITLIQRAMNGNEFKKYQDALGYILLADAYTDSSKKLEAYEKAFEIQNYNVDAIYGLIQQYDATNAGDAKLIELAEKISEADSLAFFPTAYNDLMQQIENILTKNSVPAFDILRYNTMYRATKATNNDTLQPDICKDMANSLIGKYCETLASFSFSGDNANKIVINTDYAEAGVTYQYSVDGGSKWTDFTGASVTLSNDVLAKINATNDIKVRVKGYSHEYVIDIKNTSKPSLRVNDFENIIVGDINNLQFYNNIKGTWEDYTAGNTFSNTQTIRVRYKANGTNLQSEESTVSFTKNEVDLAKSYISIKDITVEKVSSNQNGKGKELAIDGDYTTSWHTVYSGDSEKEIIFKFNEKRNLTAFDIYVDGGNGVLKDANLYISEDGESWTPAGTITANSSAYRYQNVKFNEAINTKYLKIKATNTYNVGGSHFSISDIRFYEDISDKTAPEVKIEYKVTDNNQGVVANIVTEDGAIINGANDNKTIELTEETQIITVKDASDNETREILKAINWISEPSSSIRISHPNPGNEMKVNSFVTVALVLDKDIEITNNDGSYVYKFEKNGKFIFELRNKTTGETSFVPIMVDWIAE